MLAAGIVTYNPQIINIIDQINNLGDICSLIIIVDNGSDNIVLLKKELEPFHNVMVIMNEDNLGIAKALNQIMEIANQKGFGWVLSLDQDSQLNSDLVKELYVGTNYEGVGIVCPRIYDINSGRIALVQDHYVSHSTPDFQDVEKCITSGAITSIEAWNSVGGYDEYLFIDNVDFDFCKRLKMSGYRIIESEKATLNHQIGKTEYHYLLGIHIGVMNHNAIRKYYMVRNKIYCNYKFDGRFGLRNILGIIKISLIVMLYEKDKIAKFKSIAKGIHDGVKAGKEMI